LVPASPWLDNQAPAAPAVTQSNSGNQITLNWSHPEEKDVFQWVVYYTSGNSWNYTILNNKERTFTIKPPAGQNGSVTSITKVGVTAVDRTGNESAVNLIEVK